MSKQYKRQDVRFFIADLLMIILVLVNLSLLLFDYTFSIGLVQNLIQQHAPSFYSWYSIEIHPPDRFFLIDLIFVSIFLLEFFIRWIDYVYHKVYERWFFYPFLHFYDLLGCIPIGGLRFLRILRIITLVRRMDKMGLINIKSTLLYRHYMNFSEIMTEEVSDKVIIKIVDGVKEELEYGGPVTEKIMFDVIQPKKAMLAQWLSGRIAYVADKHWDKYDEDLKLYLDEKIAEAMKSDAAVETLRKVPIAGAPTVRILESAISNVVFGVFNSIARDLTHNNVKLIEEVTDLSVEALTEGDSDEELTKFTKEAAFEILDLIVERVKIRQWKIDQENNMESASEQSA